MQVLQQDKPPKVQNMLDLDLKYEKNNPNCNLMAIYIYLCKDGPQTRQSIVNNLSFPRTTALDYLKRLIKMSWITNYVFHERKAGRPKIFWQAQVRPEELQTFFNTIETLFASNYHIKDGNENSIN